MLPPTPEISGFSFKSGVTPQEEKLLTVRSSRNSLVSPLQTVSLPEPFFRASPQAWVTLMAGMLPSPSLICIRITPSSLL